MITKTDPLNLALRIAMLSATLVFASVPVLRAQVTPVPPEPQIGSSNPITAEPSVSRPDTKPCTVTLFKNLAFADFTPKTFSYTPPDDCHGPWAKVVFTADFTVSKGRQYDRTAAFYLGHANIYYGTTAEPRKTLSPAWHVERDVTDLSAIFKDDQTGEANIGNFVGTYNGVVYNGIIYATASLEFYPTSHDDPAPRVPDIVVPVNGTGGDAGTLNTTADQITQVLNLPKNVERAYLDVIAQSQSSDEFWYFCVPTTVATELESCGNTAFRETEVTIDGKPAGVAPVYPWIYTGGIDPYLWEPIPGVQTLDFKPYRVDLTPFAGVLSDGSPHTIGVGVYNANSYFLATANVLIYRDHGQDAVRGGIIRNTLTMAPTPDVDVDIKSNTAANVTTYTGNVSVGSHRWFEIAGYVETSHGRVETSVHERVHFFSKQTFDVNPTTDQQNARQWSTVESRTTTRHRWFEETTRQRFSYPLSIDYIYKVNPDGSAYQTTKVQQKDLHRESVRVGDDRVYESRMHDIVDATDTLKFAANGTYVAVGAETGQQYHFRDSRGHCYSRELKAKDQKLVSVENGEGCGDGDHDGDDDDDR